jgi:quinol monooxygenase YgiN
MLLIVGTVRLSAESIEDARPRMAAMIQASRAEAGCLEYCYAEDVLEAGLIYIKERWTNRSTGVAGVDAGAGIGAETDS